MFWRTNEMHKFSEVIFIFPMFLLALRVSDARLACRNVPIAWYSLLDSVPDDGRVERPKHVEQVKTLET